MTGINQVINGVTAYMDAELMPHLSGAKRYGAAVYLALVQQNAVNYIKNAVNMPAVKMLGISDGNNVDVDKLHAAMSQAMKDDKLSIDIPIIGTFSFSRIDVDKLFDYIRRAS